MTDDVEFTLTRTFDAPRALVWDSYTKLEHLKRWWGPKGFEWIAGTLELRPGGRFHYCMRGPNGMEMWGKFEYREIEAPQKIVFTNSFSDKEGNTARAPFAADFPLWVLNTVTFREEAGKTILHMRGRPFEASEAEVAFFKSMFPSMNQGFAGTLGQLDAYLKEQTK